MVLTGGEGADEGRASGGEVLEDALHVARVGLGVGGDEGRSGGRLHGTGRTACEVWRRRRARGVGARRERAGKRRVGRSSSCGGARAGRMDRMRICSLLCLLLFYYKPPKDEGRIPKMICSGCDLLREPLVRDADVVDQTRGPDGGTHLEVAAIGSRGCRALTGLVVVGEHRAYDRLLDEC